MTKKPKAKKRQIPAFELTGDKLAAYNSGFWDGNEGHYWPGGMDTACYDRGHTDGQKYGPRKGKPWGLEEILAELAKLPGGKP